MCRRRIGARFAMCRPLGDDGLCVPDADWGCTPSPPPSPPLPPPPPAPPPHPPPQPYSPPSPPAPIICVDNFADCFKERVAFTSADGLPGFTDELECCKPAMPGNRPFGCFQRPGKTYAQCRPLVPGCVSTNEWQCPENPPPMPPGAPPSPPPPPQPPRLSNAQWLARSSVGLGAGTSGGGEGGKTPGASNAAGSLLLLLALLMLLCRYVVQPKLAGRELSRAETQSRVSDDLMLLGDVVFGLLTRFALSVARCVGRMARGRDTLPTRKAREMEDEAAASLAGDSTGGSGDGVKGHGKGKNGSRGGGGGSTKEAAKRSKDIELQNAIKRRLASRLAVDEDEDDEEESGGRRSGLRAGREDEPSEAPLAKGACKPSSKAAAKAAAKAASARIVDESDEDDEELQQGTSRKGSEQGKRKGPTAKAAEKASDKKSLLTSIGSEADFD